MCKQHLKYFPGFLPIGFLLNGIRDQELFVASKAAVSFPSGLGVKTRVLELVVTDVSPAGNLNIQKRAEVCRGECIASTELLLTEDGDFVAFEKKVERLELIKRGELFHARVRYVSAVFKHLSASQYAQLAEVLSSPYAVTNITAGKILLRLCTLLDADIEKRKRRLQGLIDLQGMLHQTVSRCSGLA